MLVNKLLEISPEKEDDVKSIEELFREEMKETIDAIKEHNDRIKTLLYFLFIFVFVFVLFLTMISLSYTDIQARYNVQYIINYQQERRNLPNKDARPIYTVNRLGLNSPELQFYPSKLYKFLPE